jgi:GxxExxY protein
MDADKKIDLPAGRVEQFPLKKETQAIIGCAFAVLNELGHGLDENCYENALAVEFKLQGIDFEQQRSFDVIYRGIPVGRFRPDLIAYRQVVIDTKTIDRITDHERGQMLNYLRITGLPVGLILNFKHAKLEFERIVLSDANRRK